MAQANRTTEQDPDDLSNIRGADKGLAKLPDDVKGVPEKEIAAAIQSVDGTTTTEDERATRQDVDDDDAPGGKPARRSHAERRNAQREARARTDRQIAELGAIVTAQSQEIAQLKGQGFRRDEISLDDRINGAQQALADARAARASARQANDLGAEEAAEEAMYAARRQVEVLAGVKQRVETQKRMPPPQMAAGGAPPPDPDTVRHAQKWMSKNDWYDPNGGNMDSRVTLLVDAEVKQDGFDPRTKEYWDEMNERLKGYLPHRFTEGDGSGTRQSSEEDQDDSQSGGRGNSRGGSPTGGSSRESVAAGGERITIPKAYIDALKEAGYDWDDPEVKRRMTARYIAGRKEMSAR